MARLAAIAIALAVAGCGDSPRDTGQWAEADGAVTIKNNGGGLVREFLAQREAFLASGVEVRIEGYCASACVVFYSLPNACMAYGSSLHFHGVSTPAFGFGEGYWEAKISATLRGGIREGYDAGWDELTAPMHKIGRGAAIRLDPNIRKCEVAP